MIQLLFKPDWNNKDFAVACSGGVDSMVMLAFALNAGRRPTVLFFDHGIPEDAPGLEVIQRTVAKHSLELKIHVMPREREKSESTEEYWRKERYRWLYSLDMPVLTGHHLGDVIETWLFSSFNGQPKLIPAHTNNIHRPLLTTPREEIVKWALVHDVEWHEDELNLDLRFSRCRIRHMIVPEVLKINPGIGSMLRKKLIQREAQDRLENKKSVINSKSAKP